MEEHDLGNGCALHVAEVGAGRPIVLIHGWASSSRIWRDVSSDLSHHHHIIAPDLPGFGASPACAARTIAAYAEVIRTFLDLRQLRDVLLLGWSMGGQVALSYWRQFRQHRLRALGIVDVSPCCLPAPGWPATNTPFSAESIASWSRDWSDEPAIMLTDINTAAFADPTAHATEIADLVSDGLRADKAAALEAFGDGLRSDFRQDLPEIDIPTLLMYGAHSTSAAEPVRTFLQKCIKTSTLVVFEESAHALMFEEREKFSATLSGFASSYDS
jgi:pimeloyl-ACP methyl ester carboxylesterase